MKKDLSDFTVSSELTLLQAVEKIDRNHSRAVLVVDQGVVVGVISEGDVMRALLKGADIHAPLSGLAKSSFKFLRAPDWKAAFELCSKHLISLVPVVDERFHLQDVLTLREVLERARLL